LRIAAGDTKKMQNEPRTSMTGTVQTVPVQESTTGERVATLIIVAVPEACSKAQYLQIFP
jgi:hypothetical protein